MLCIDRHFQDEILIGDDIRVMIVKIDGNQVRLGITAPDDVKILRSELKKKEPKNDLHIQRPKTGGNC